MGDHDKEASAEHVATQETEHQEMAPVATQQACEFLVAATAVLRYLGTLPPPIGGDIVLPLPQTPDEELHILFARENQTNAKQKGYFTCFSLQDDSRGAYQPTSRDNSTIRIRRDLKGELHISIKDNKNLGLRGTTVIPAGGTATSLTTTPTEWMYLSHGSVIHFCPQAPPPTPNPGLLQDYDAFKYSLQIFPPPGPFPSKEPEQSESRTVKVVFPDSWIGALMGPAGDNLRELRHRYKCTITVSARGHLHPNATDFLGRTVIFCALQQQLANLFDDLFQHIVEKFGSPYLAQFMIIIPSTLAGRILGLEGRRIRSWRQDYDLKLELRDSVEVSERLLVAAGTVSALTSFTAAFLDTVGGDWRYAVGVDYVGASGTKRRHEPGPASRGNSQAKGKHRQIKQAARAVPSAWEGRRLHTSVDAHRRKGPE